MRLAGALLYASFVAAAFASGLPRTSPVWAVLVWAVFALFALALLRVHAVVNAPKRDQ